MAASEDRLRPGKVRLRLGDRRVLVVPTYSADAAPTAHTSPAATPTPVTPPPAAYVAPPLPDTSQPSPTPMLHHPRQHKAVIAIIEAVPARAEALAAAMITAMELTGGPCAAVSMEPQNRLGIRFGCVTQSDPHVWQRDPAALGVQQGNRRVIPAPSPEEALDGTALADAIAQIADRAEFTVIDLGCRWVPRLFRPVLPQATHIWVVARAGQWTGVEMRLEQAEFSGWTPMHRVRIVVVGEESTVPPHLSPMLAGVLRDPESAAVHGLMDREFRRGNR